MSFQATTLPCHSNIVECPACHQATAQSAGKCCFCGQRVGPAHTGDSTGIVANCGQACHSARTTRLFALALPPLLVLWLVPALHRFGAVSAAAILLFFLLRCTDWWLAYSAIDCTDPHYLRARRSIKFAGIMAALLSIPCDLLPFFHWAMAVVRSRHL